MSTNYLENLKILRQKIPVGMAHALKIIEATNGDIEQAENILKQEYINNLVEKTRAPKELVEECLIKNSFDIETSLKEIESKVYSSTELIFKYYSKDKRRGITLILDVIEKKIEANVKEEQDIRVYGWFNFELFKMLDSTQFCFATVAQWLFFEYCEDFDSAIHYHTDIVTEHIEKKLDLPELANNIKICRERSSYFNKKYKNKKKGFLLAHDKIREDALYIKAKKNYFDQEELLIETLYNFVKTHIGQFP
ncbi:hypothetical protein [Emticicia fontis]